MRGRRKRTIRMYAAIFRDGSDGRRLYIAHWSWHARMKFASDRGKRSDSKEQLQERWRKAYQEGWRIVPVDVTLVKRKRPSLHHPVTRAAARAKPSKKGGAR